MKLCKTAALFFVLLFFIFSTPFLFSQSPYSSVKFVLIDSSQKNYIYTINEYVCSFAYEPVVPSGDYWFGKDTSTLNWESLPDSLVNSISVKKISSAKGKTFEYGNQQMIWEHIITLTITRQNIDLKNDEPAIYDTMIIVMPVLLKSFVTYIHLGTIPFKEGYFEILSGFIYDSSDWLKITLPADFQWQSIGFEERKIKINPGSFPK